nr:hypothetical protein [Tanacetum cinerariifolium]
DVVTGVDAGIDTKFDVRIIVKDEVKDEVESSDRGTIEVGVDVAAGIDIPDGMLIPDAVERLEQRGLEASSLIADGERASLLDQVASLERSNVRHQGTMMMERARADRFWRRVSFIESELRQIRRFRYYDRMRFRRLETFAVRRLENEVLYKCQRFLGVLIMKLTNNDVVNFALKMKRDTIIKNLDMEPKINAVMRDFLDSFWWKELSKETGSEILPSGDGSHGKMFKPLASLIKKGKLK